MWASVLAVEIPIGFIAGGEKEIETERSQRRENQASRTGGK